MQPPPVGKYIGGVRAVVPLPCDVPRRPPVADHIRLSGDLGRGRLSLCRAVRGRGSGPARVEEAIQAPVGDHQPAGIYILVTSRFGRKPEPLPDIGSRENHAASLAPAMIVAMKPVRAPVGNHGMREHPIIRYPVHGPQLAQQFAQRRILGGSDVLIVITHHLNADGIIVDIVMPLPHAPPRMCGNPGAVDDAQHTPVPGDKVVSLPPAPDLGERTPLRPFRRVQYNVEGVRPARTLPVFRTQAAADLERGGRLPALGPQQPYRPREACQCAKPRQQELSPRRLPRLCHQQTFHPIAVSNRWTAANQG